MTKPVSPARIQIAADYGMMNVDYIALACREVGVPFFVACALFEKESKGGNVWGHDVGGTLSGYEEPVTRGGYRVFRWLVIEKGGLSNGVGPSQITWKGYFTDMEDKGLRPWDIHDNMVYGLTVLRDHYVRYGSWETAGRLYNGKLSYGQDLVVKIAEWKHRLRESRTAARFGNAA